MQKHSSFGALLKRYRLAAGLSQEGLAERAHLSPRTISDLERGVHGVPHADTLALLVSALSLSEQQRGLLLSAARPELAPVGEAAPASPSPAFPLPPTRLIGRGQERAQALSLLRRTETRLLTLTGPGGVGKTRLALQLLQDLAPDFTDGVVFVGLVPIRDAALVPGLIAQALRLREGGASSLAEQVQVDLQGKHLLLLLDNVEQVPDCAVFLADLVARCPRLVVLVTSRTPLRLRAEQEFRLAPLQLDEAITLLSERLQAARPGSAAPTSEIAAICEQVDRLPLALELAAVHVKILTLPQLRTRLGRRLDVLRGGARDLPARQQSMEEAIAWSYELLTAEEQRCFRALSVFEGGWTLEAAEVVCWTADKVTPEAPLLTLAALVETSLVQTETLPNGTLRFYLLELMRDFARQRLRAAGEEEPCQRRHADYYARLAEAADARFGAERAVLDAPFAEESHNARAAMQWVEEHQEAELGLRLTGITHFWHMQGQISEAERWLERMLALDQQTRVKGMPAAPLSLRIEKLYGLGRVLLGHGKLERAETVTREALELAQRLGDAQSLSNAWATLGMIAQAGGKIDDAVTAFTACAQHASHAGDIGVKNRALVQLGELARMQGNLERATTLLEEALATARALEMRWDSAIISTLLGHVARQQQNHSLAKARYRESLPLLREFGSPTYTAWCLEGYAAVFCVEGQAEQATRLCAVAVTLRQQADTPLPPAEQAAFDQVVASVKASLGEQTFIQEWTIGAALTQDEAISFALLEKQETD
ncbi:MAG TPA: tetratricopeptide repeat protein [Ktedonobacterales bacterium]|nr:tetratricopeptide repeat protein [Ktedonobacterales bacterium]